MTIYSTDHVIKSFWIRHCHFKSLQVNCHILKRLACGMTLASMRKHNTDQNDRHANQKMT